MKKQLRKKYLHVKLTLDEHKKYQELAILGKFDNTSDFIRHLVRRYEIENKC